MSIVSAAVGERRAGDVVAAAAHRQRRARARGRSRRRRRRRPCRPAGRRARASWRSSPFQSRVASSKPASPGAAAARPGARAAPRPRAPRTNASGCSIGGSSAQSSITCSGQPWRALAASATASGVARSCRPQISASGTAIRASSSAAIAGSPNSSIRPSAAITPACGAVEVVGRERAPSARPSARAGRRGRTRSGATAGRGSRSSGCAMNACSALPELRRRVERRRGRARRRARGRRSGRRGRRRTRRDRAAERVADQHRRRRARSRSISSPSQAEPSSASSVRGAVAGQVGRDHAVACATSAVEHAHPVRRVGAGPVQQHQRRAVAALQHGGRDAGDVQPPLGDREAGEQALGGRVDVRFEHAADATQRRGARASAEPPNPRRRARVGGFSSTSSCWYA